MPSYPDPRWAEAAVICPGCRTWLMVPFQPGYKDTIRDYCPNCVNGPTQLSLFEIEGIRT